MALVKCKECRSEVSTKALACPKCGAQQPKQPKRTSPATWAIAGGILLITIVVIASRDQPRPMAGQVNATVDPQRQARLTAAGLAAGVLRMGMKDPEAFALTSLVVMPDGQACYRYRAKNSFGAVLPGRAVLAGGKMLVEENEADDFQRAWGRECAGNNGDEIAAQVSRAIERAK